MKNNRIQFYNNCEMSGGNFIQYQRNMPDDTKMQMAKTIDMEAIPILWTFIESPIKCSVIQPPVVFVGSHSRPSEI